MKDIIRMNQLAGIITEGQANKMMAILKEDDMSTDTTLSPEKQLLLKNAISQGNEYDGLSWDGLLDLTDEDMKLVRWLEKTLTKMKKNNEISFDLDF